MCFNHPSQKLKRWSNASPTRGGGHLTNTHSSPCIIPTSSDPNEQRSSNRRTQHKIFQPISWHYWRENHCRRSPPICPNLQSSLDCVSNVIVLTLRPFDWLTHMMGRDNCIDGVTCPFIHQSSSQQVTNETRHESISTILVLCDLKWVEE